MVCHILIACQKESPLTEGRKESPELAKKSGNYFIIAETSSVRDYPVRKLYNECYPETVDFTGPVSYYIQYLQVGDAQYISYDIDFGNFSGTGETSGLKYSTNRKRYKGIVPTIGENVRGATIIGRKILKMTFKASAGNAIYVTEK